MLHAWLLATCALAQSSGYPIDVELLDPSIGADGIPGVDLPRVDRSGTIRVGLGAQYEDDPVTVYDAVRDVELGSVVARRAAWSVGLSADLSERVTLEGSLPGATSWQTEVQQFSADGTGLGDAALSARWLLARGDAVSLGARGAIRLPTGRVNAWLGERGVRFSPSLLASLALQPVTLGLDARLQLRSALQTTEDLRIGPELRVGGAARFALPDASRLALTTSLIARTGIEGPRGPGETALEALGGLQVRPSRDLTLDLGAGRGLTEGYGTTDLRLYSQLVYRHRRAERDPVPESPRARPAQPLLSDPVRPASTPSPEDRKVVVTQTRFVLAEQPRFLVDTAVLLESSRPLVDEVARRFAEHPEVAHVVIEGHASAEGPHSHNYELSLRRAHTIWKALIEAGVDQDRISFRAKGETAPINRGTDATQLEQNRRVEFRITANHPGPPPESPRDQTVPWTGERRAVGSAAPE